MEIEVGKIYGAWLVKSDLGYGYKYRCVCTVCANTVQDIRKYDLVSGSTLMCKSCSSRTSKLSHGMSDTSEYSTWTHMNQRCHNPNNKDYPNYGGRGIKVCDVWRDSFEAFYMCVGPKPGPEYTIERVDFNKGYEPGNVVWATRTTQNRNRSNNINIEYEGETKLVSAWAEDDRCPVSANTLYKRISRGWLEKYGVEETLFKSATTKGGKDEQ